MEEHCRGEAFGDCSHCDAEVLLRKIRNCIRCRAPFCRTCTKRCGYLDTCHFCHPSWCILYEHTPAFWEPA
jgi:hypothetical protein